MRPYGGKKNTSTKANLPYRGASKTKFLSVQFKPDDSFGFSSDPADPAQNASAAFQTLYVEGPSNGIHIIASADTYNNVNRFLGRKGLSEFEMSVLFQMSATDSSSLTDLPIAGHLGLYGAVYYNDREGRTETFRPYALPEGRWIQQVAGHFAGQSRSGGSGESNR